MMLMYTKDKNKIISCRLNDEQFSILVATASNYNISVSILCRNIITQYINERIENYANFQTNEHD